MKMTVVYSVVVEIPDETLDMEKLEADDPDQEYIEEVRDQAKDLAGAIMEDGGVEGVIHEADLDDLVE